MAHKISDETMDYISALAKLELSEEERRQARQDMEKMLDYIGQLGELDTEGAEPAPYIFPIFNVFREDVEENGDGQESMLANAPAQKDGLFQVPKTVDETP